MEINAAFHIIQLTDIHGADFLIREIAEPLSEADLIILSGDITHFGKKEQAKKIIDQVRNYNTNLLAIHGNCDFPEVEVYLENEHISLHNQIKIFERFVFCGLGGSLPCPTTTPNEFRDEMAAKWLNSTLKSLDKKLPLLFVSHQPPLNTQNDLLTDNTHVGSWSVRQFIEKADPLICLTGHIHEALGIDYIGKCPIINPGPFRTGKFADIFIDGENEVRIELNQITF